MPDVWTHCNSSLNRDLEPVVEEPAGRWAHAKNFASRDELHDWLASLDCEGRIGTLVINSHGDTGGVLKLDVELGRRTNDQVFFDWFRPLQRYLAPGGHLWFTGCSMAQLEPGTELLQRISWHLPSRVLIGHDRQTYNPTTGVGYTPGNILIRDVVEIASAAEAHLLERRVDKYHPATKWMRNGRVLRYPRDEQRGREGMRCAYPRCEGHDDASHQCDGGWDPGCRWQGTPTSAPEPGIPNSILWAPGDPSIPGKTPKSRRIDSGRQPRHGGAYLHRGPLGARHA